MRICALLSGGKDSNYALYRALQEGLDIGCIIVVKSARNDSWLFHTVYPELAVLQAEAMGLRDRVYIVEVSGEKDKEFIEFKEALSKLKSTVDFDGLLCGAIASQYQLSRFKKVSEALGLELYAPLWGIDQVEYMRKLVEEGFVFIISKISTMGLPRAFLGVPVDKSIVEKIIVLAQKYGFNPSFEGGEAETLVVTAPHYVNDICIEGSRNSLSEFEHIIEIHRYWLGKKGSNCLSISG
ncbi:MAG: diphthine--ammonia ligase [Ignisphaera sp.]